MYIYICIVIYIYMYSYLYIYIAIKLINHGRTIPYKCRLKKVYASELSQTSIPWISWSFPYGFPPWSVLERSRLSTTTDSATYSEPTYHTATGAAKLVGEEVAQVRGVETERTMGRWQNPVENEDLIGISWVYNGIIEGVLMGFHSDSMGFHEI